MVDLVKLLYVISTALQIPVVVVLLLLLGWTALQAGGALREYLDLRKYRKRVRMLIAELKSGEASTGNFTNELKELRGPGAGMIRAAERGVNETVLAKIIDDVQLKLDRRVNRLTVGVRLGPMFGLMGTLIPMGPALTGLAGGDINVLTENLVVAFSTTVLGLLIGGVCYILLSITRRFYAQDMSDIDFLHDILLKEKPNAGAHAVENP